MGVSSETLEEEFREKRTGQGLENPNDNVNT